MGARDGRFPAEGRAPAGPGRGTPSARPSCRSHSLPALTKRTSIECVSHCVQRERKKERARQRAALQEKLEELESQKLKLVRLLKEVLGQEESEAKPRREGDGHLSYAAAVTGR